MLKSISTQDLPYFIPSAEAEKVQDAFRQHEKRPRLKRLLVRNGDRIHFLPLAEIDWIEARGRNSRVHAGKQTHLIREGLIRLESSLDPLAFVRVNKSTIVRLDRIRELHRWFHGNYRIILQDEITLMLSRRYKKNLTEALGQFF
jgi:two-component system LytT family response regulator